MKKKIVLPVLVILIALLAPVVVMATPGDLPGVNDVPLDGGLSVLLAAGVGYGIKKVRDGRKEKKQADI
ncbi:MAG: hypothetical protein LH478_06785, partial [Chitinophagaceae bacterium]|nr:hypothetical protein [Chitinophagaceae bacterium]